MCSSERNELKKALEENKQQLVMMMITTTTTISIATEKDVQLLEERGLKNTEMQRFSD
jgi:hypothetical protein